MFFAFMAFSKMNTLNEPVEAAVTQTAASLLQMGIYYNPFS